MYPCVNCRAAAVGPDGRCGACGAYQPGAGAYPAPPPAMPPPPGMPLAVDLRRGLSTALTVLFGCLVAALIGVVVARSNQYDVLESFLERPLSVSQEDADEADGFFTVMSVVYGLLVVATAVVWAVWFRRLRGNAEVFAPGTQRFGTGWAAGAWFTPVVNFWFPKQIANDIWRASSPAGPQHAGRGLLNAWWATWIVGFAVNAVASVNYTLVEQRMKSPGYDFSRARDDIERLQSAVGVSRLSYLVFIAAAVLALLVVRQVTRMQEQRAGMSPQGPVPSYGYPVAPGTPYGGVSAQGGAPGAPHGAPAAPYGTAGAPGAPGAQGPWGPVPGGH